MSTQIARYRLDDDTVVCYEIDPPAGFRPASADTVIGKVKDAVRPAMEAARVVLDKAREAGPDEVEVAFGIKVTGTADWLIAKASGETNFKVTMTWSSDRAGSSGSEPASPPGPESPAPYPPDPASPPPASARGTGAGRS